MYYFDISKLVIPIWMLLESLSPCDTFPVFDWLKYENICHSCHRLNVKLTKSTLTDFTSLGRWNRFKMRQHIYVRGHPKTVIVDGKRQAFTAFDLTDIHVINWTLRNLRNRSTISSGWLDHWSQVDTTEFEQASEVDDKTQLGILNRDFNPKCFPPRVGMMCYSDQWQSKHNFLSTFGVS